MLHKMYLMILIIYLFLHTKPCEVALQGPHKSNPSPDRLRKTKYKEGYIYTGETQSPNIFSKVRVRLDFLIPDQIFLTPSLSDLHELRNGHKSKLVHVGAFINKKMPCNSLSSQSILWVQLCPHLSRGSGIFRSSSSVKGFESWGDPGSSFNENDIVNRYHAQFSIWMLFQQVEGSSGRGFSQAQSSSNEKEGTLWLSHLTCNTTTNMTWVCITLN